MIVCPAMLLSHPLLADDYPITAIPFTDIKLTDTLWAPRQDTNRRVTVEHNFREMEKQGSIDAFRILAGDSSEKYHGYMWGDSDTYKTIEGALYGLRTQPDPGLEKQLETLISQIGRSQAKSGFLFPHLQITQPNYKLFTNETSGTCESYSMGHLMESAVEHFRTTGRTNYLAVARRAADLMVKVNQEGKLLQVSGHPEVEIGLVKLYQATGCQEYLDLAQRLVNGYQTQISLWSNGQPALATDDVLGHAVAVMYLYAGACDVAVLKGDQERIGLLERKWDRMVSRKMYITGGVGNRGHHEGFSQDYDLPDGKESYCETCSAIADIFWSSRMFRATGNAKYYDVVERVLYNNLAAGAGLSGDRFFYVNRLSCRGKDHPVRWSWHGCPCCPANLVRFWPRLSEYLFATGKTDLYVNLFAACEGKVTLAGTPVKVCQKTGYPWDGTVRIELNPEKPVKFALRMRIPGWAEGRPLPSDLYSYLNRGNIKVELKVNGELTDAPRAKGYAVIERTWSAGDRVDLILSMPVQRVVANEKVSSAKGKVALERGPLVYCVEGADNAGGVQQLVLTDEVVLRAAPRPALLGGITVLEGTAVEAYHREDGTVATRPVDLTAIPYQVWCHRGPNAMEVWLPRTADKAVPLP